LGITERKTVVRRRDNCYEWHRIAADRAKILPVHTNEHKKRDEQMRMTDIKKRNKENSAE